MDATQEPVQSISAITLLTRSGWLAYGSYGVAAVSITIGVLAYLHV